MKNITFSEVGKYEVFYFVRDGATEQISPMKRSAVYRDKAGNGAPPAPAFPELPEYPLNSDGTTVKTTVMLDWNPVADPDFDALTYTVLISRRSDFATIAFRAEELEHTVLPIGGDTLTDGKTYWWKVMAVDANGRRASSVARRFRTNNTNPAGYGWVEGTVSNAQSAGIAVVGATVTVGGLVATTESPDGYYFMTVPAGTSLPMSVTGAAGYHDVTGLSVSVSAGRGVMKDVSLTPLTPPVAPETSIVSMTPPGSPTSSTTMTFTYTSSDPAATFECRHDAGTTVGPFIDCTGGKRKSYTGLSDGVHAFYVRARSALGIADASPATYSWAVDTAIPETAITSGPPAIANVPIANFTYSSTVAGSTFRCSFDNIAYSVCASSYTKVDGTYTLYAKAVSPSLRIDPTPASWTWTVDTKVPNTMIGSGPMAETRMTTAAFAFSSDEAGAIFECSLDGAGYAPCSSPRHYAVAPGNHGFFVRARDAAGNIDGTPATWYWKVDRTPPKAPLVGTTGTTPTPTNDATPTWTWAAAPASGGIGTFRHKRNNPDLSTGATVTRLSSYSPATDLSPGAHTLYVQERDRAGNWSASGSFTIVIDATAPETTITGSPADPTTATEGTFTFVSTEEGSTFQCRLDGSEYATCASPLTYAALSVGSHTFSVRAEDPAGNRDATPATYTWQIVPPLSAESGQPGGEGAAAR